MASSDPEIKDGFPIPIWMKSKPTREFEPFAASPPAPEDSFFFIRYPKSEIFSNTTDKESPKINIEKDLPKVDLSKVLSDQGKELASASYNFKEKDWSKHTKPCQDVLHGIQPINTAVNSATSKPKPAGTDDGFKGEGAACGNSIVKVAHQMISSSRGGGGVGGRGFTVAAPEEEEAVPPSPQQYNLSARRGSRSLPSSPSTSPTARRKRNTNRYFTSPFEPVEAGGRSWLTAALLGFKKDLTASSSTLAEEDDTIDTRLHGVSLAQSVESLGPAPRGRAPPAPAAAPPPPPAPAKPAPSPAFRPKPSELREMNFWSPTSM